MSKRRRTTPRPRRGRVLVSLLAVVAVVVTALAIVVGRAVLAEDPVERVDPPVAPPPATATPLADYDRDGMTLVRAPFCGRVDADSAAVALDVASVAAPGAWRPGTPVPGTESLANEWGCSVAAGEVTASAWVFATPVGTDGAREWVRDAARGGCKRRDVPAIGSPGAVVTCGSGDDKETTYQGLVGDTWLACRLTGTGDAERVGRWCVVVLEAVRGD